MKKYCENCGKKLEEDFKVCPYCGGRNEHEKKGMPEYIKVGLIIFLCLIGFVLLSIVLENDSSDKKTDNLTSTTTTTSSKEDMDIQIDDSYEDNTSNKEKKTTQTKTAKNQKNQTTQRTTTKTQKNQTTQRTTKEQKNTTVPSTTKQDSISVSKKNAVRKAKDYLSVLSFSRKGLIEQLEFDKFSHEDAVYGVDNSGANWNTQAAKSAKNYLSVMAFSRDELIEQLEFDGFSHEQAVYGVNQTGL